MLVIMLLDINKRDNFDSEHWRGYQGEKFECYLVIFKKEYIYCYFILVQF